jgi:hypothetical protein
MMKIEPLSESEKLALREMLKRQMAKRIIQRRINEGLLVGLPNGRLIEKADHPNDEPSAGE